LRVAKWIDSKAGIGGGDDPIGFLLASHEMLARERKDLRREIIALKIDNDRLVALLHPPGLTDTSYDELVEAFAISTNRTVKE
jgi:hypothetical protein